jgi:hypothetical protein
MLAPYHSRKKFPLYFYVSKSKGGARAAWRSAQVQQWLIFSTNRDQ